MIIINKCISNINIVLCLYNLSKLSNIKNFKNIRIRIYVKKSL